MATADTAHYADLFAALGAEPRLEIMRLLFAAYPNCMNVGEIQAQVKIPNSTLSHHLEKLKIEGLVECTRDKQYLCYSAKAETVTDLVSFLYNGAGPANQSYIELTPDPPRAEGSVLGEVFKSIETMLGDLFTKIALPKGFERLTQKAIQAIILAQQESNRLDHKYVGTEQLVLGLLAEESGIAAQVLTATGLTLDPLRVEIERNIGRGSGTPIEIPFTPKAKRALDLAVMQARQLGHSYVGTEHLLLGILLEGQGLGVQVLKNLGIDLGVLQERLRAAMT